MLEKHVNDITKEYAHKDNCSTEEEKTSSVQPLKLNPNAVKQNNSSHLETNHFKRVLKPTSSQKNQQKPTRMK